MTGRKRRSPSVQRSWPPTGKRSQAVRVLEADGAVKRGLLWSTVTSVVAEEEDEETRADGAALVADKKEKKPK